MGENTGLIFASSVDTNVVLAVMEHNTLSFMTVSNATKRGLRSHFIIPDVAGRKLPLALDDGDGIHLVKEEVESKYLLASASASDQPVYIHREAGNVVILKTMDGTVLGRDGYKRVALDIGAKVFENGSAEYSLGPIQAESDEDPNMDADDGYGNDAKSDAPSTLSKRKLALFVTVMLVGVLGLVFLFHSSRTHARVTKTSVRSEMPAPSAYRYMYR